MDPRVSGRDLTPPNTQLEKPNESDYSLHPPLLLCLPARRLVLELLPFPSRLIILPVDHVRVNFLRRPYRPVPQPGRHHRQRSRTPAGASSASVSGSGGSRPSAASVGGTGAIPPRKRTQRSQFTGFGVVREALWYRVTGALPILIKPGAITRPCMRWRKPSDPPPCS